MLFTDLYNLLDPSRGYQSLNEIDLSALKKLKEVDFYFEDPEFEDDNFNKIQKAIATALRRPDLKVFWHSVRVTYTHFLTEYDQMMENIGSLASFQLKHFEKLKDKVDYDWECDFNWTMAKLLKGGFDLKSEEFALKFFAKFSFRRIEVTGKVKEEELLLELIARSPSLWSLNFFSSDLDQLFFDRMADTVRVNDIPLRQLRLVKPSKKNLNFDFVFKLCHLELFKTDQPLSPELISKMLTLMPSITKIKFSSSESINDQSESESRIKYLVIEQISTNRILRNDEYESDSESDWDSDLDFDSSSGWDSDSSSGWDSDSSFDSDSDRDSKCKCVLM